MKKNDDITFEIEQPTETTAPQEEQEVLAVATSEEVEESSATSSRKDRKAVRQNLLRSLVNDEEESEHEIQHLKDVVQALSIDGLWFRRQIGLFLLIVVGIILYITSRYKAQQEMIEEARLRTELQDWKYRSMTVSSELTTKSRQSQLENRLKVLGDSTLQISKTAPFEIIKK